ncbi:MAG: ribonuclease HI [Acidaminococcus sp.]|nr:ribonuclease HI [Acidaminococcus sp.]MDD7398602.1 ribonuclease HI [Bacillota bacterium]MDY4559319.1 ribonuclease HI [Eubacteriales bacterium]MDY5345155.1 ribonuclease HI [Eubacteriales bacterium]
MANPFVTIYTDGACSGNPGPGGWGVILMHGQNKKELSGGETDTTNNRMELLAVIRGLKTLTKPCNVELYSDSAYVINAFNQNWIENWQKSDWKTSSKSPVKNKDLWLDLLSLLKVHNVKFIKVKGHSDNQFNNRCDELARNEIVKIQKTNIV